MQTHKYSVKSCTNVFLLSSAGQLQHWLNTWRGQRFFWMTISISVDFNLLQEEMTTPFSAKYFHSLGQMQTGSHQQTLGTFAFHMQATAGVEDWLQAMKSCKEIIHFHSNSPLRDLISLFWSVLITLRWRGMPNVFSGSGCWILNANASNTCLFCHKYLRSDPALWKQRPWTFHETCNKMAATAVFLSFSCNIFTHMKLKWPWLECRDPVNTIV